MSVRKPVATSGTRLYLTERVGLSALGCGWVIVGDGAGGAIETTTAAGPVTQATSAELEDASAVTTPTRVVDRGAWLALAAAAFGQLLVTIGGIAIQRLRRRSLA